MVKLHPTSNNLCKGIGIMLSLLFLVVMTSVFFPYQMGNTEYQKVDSSLLLANPDSFEGSKVSTSAIIAGIGNQTSEQEHLYESVDGPDLLIPPQIANVSVGDRIALRGISYLSSFGYIEVTEVHIYDYPIDGLSRSMIHSIPGIIGFVIIFIAVFKFDTKRFRFISRRD